MKRIAAISIFLAPGSWLLAPASAQPTAISSTDLISGAPAVLNYNFAWLNTYKVGAISLDGSNLGAFGALNLVTPQGMSWSLTPNNTTLNIQPQLDTALVPYRTTANSYSPGAKQSVSTDGANAGLNIQSAALPGNPATGDLAIDRNGNLNWYSGSAWAQGAAADATLTAGAPIIGNGGNHVTAGSTTGSGSFVLSTAPVLNNPYITSAVNFQMLLGGGSLLVSAQASAPVTSSDTCAPGTQAFDSTYLYVCVAANTWKRVALSSF